jgi:SAM-dependent methyltransferase
MDDADAYRAESRERWEAVAKGWEAHRDAFQRVAEPVTQWLIDALAPQPGQTILELAAGVGETGFRAAPLVGPSGKVISTDGSEAMVEAARRRAEQLGLENVETRPMDAEWIDLETATVDGVLCRWGYMLVADPETALRETRRVLRSGGKVALAAWDAPERNMWARSMGAELVSRGLAPPPDPSGPGMFSFAPEGHVEELLGGAGFLEVVVDTVDVTFSAASFDEWWEYQFDVSPSLSEALAAATPEQRDEVYEGVQAQLEPFRAEDGSYAIPGRALVAAGEA